MGYIMPEQEAMKQLDQVLESYGLEFTIEMLSELCEARADHMRDSIPAHVGTPQQWDAAAAYLTEISQNPTVKEAR